MQFVSVSRLSVKAIPAMQTEKLYEWLGAAFGVVGALLLASNSTWSPYGWIFFLFSNACLIAFAVRKQFRGLMLMQLVFTATSLLGIYRWMF